ncbi:DnaJ-domain-containing protein [Trametes versicolor FP-101664 SS1]|uniref:DnaJ-domain-containing protein n=1 Tax=Trametes versicolor (strain FP-101664) TaxID=717944 RepID=UPI0004621839|nr:DnaJ-domain-containing protein [Trametes versicolor FP-101664 SS1]EIW55739.1 DnaJ-domain-containing protein [Trametes versicolor FP-101664 SS1]
MSAPEEDVNPYELLELSIEASEQEIRTAYRQRSLKVHPDRNRGNPDAARKFHELYQAQELLLDPLRRMALDAKLRLKEARKARFSQYDNKRKNLVEELEERERAFKKARTETEAQKKERWRENERIMEEGRRLREDREKELQKKEREREELGQSARSELEPPSLGPLDTTIRVKYTLTSHPSLTSAASISALLTPFGALDESSIVLSLKPAPPKKPKRGTALVPFKQIVGAFGAVGASGRAENGLADIEVDWAEGKEPELIGWLKKMGKLGGGSSGSSNQPPTANSGTKAATAQTPLSSDYKATNSPHTQAPSTSAFASFPSTFPDFNVIPQAPTASTDVPGIDYESMTLLRMRQAERERIEREIREQEAQEG